MREASLVGRIPRCDPLPETPSPAAGGHERDVVEPRVGPAMTTMLIGVVVLSVGVSWSDTGEVSNGFT